MRSAVVALSMGSVACGQILSIDPVTLYDAGQDAGLADATASSGSETGADTGSVDGSRDGGDAALRTDGSSPEAQPDAGVTCGPEGGPLSACDGACIDVRGTDAANCGACGHGCQGGTCAAGMCRPVTLATVNPPPAMALAVGGPNVYWSQTLPADAGMGGTPGLETCAIGGCNGQSTVVGGVVWVWGAFAVALPNVYWDSGDYRGFLGCPINGCTNPVSLAPSPTARTPVVVIDHAQNLYWVDSQNNQVVSCAAGGCGGTPTVVQRGDSGFVIRTIAVDDNNLYWVELNPTTNAATIARTAHGAAYAISMADEPSGAPVTSLVVDNMNVYWSRPSDSGGTVHACAIMGCRLNPTVLAQGRTGTLDLVADGANVYWTESQEVIECAHAQCAGNPTVLASGLNNPEHLASDAINLYWDTRIDGSIMKLAKP